MFSLHPKILDISQLKDKVLKIHKDIVATMDKKKV